MWQACTLMGHTVNPGWQPSCSVTPDTMAQTVCQECQYVLFWDFIFWWKNWKEGRNGRRKINLTWKSVPQSRILINNQHLWYLCFSTPEKAKKPKAQKQNKLCHLLLLLLKLQKYQHLLFLAQRKQTSPHKQTNWSMLQTTSISLASNVGKETTVVESSSKAEVFGDHQWGIQRLIFHFCYLTT